VLTEDGPRIVTTLEPHAKPRRHRVLENFEQEHAVAGVDAPNLFMGSMLVTACMTMAVVMVLASAQQPGARDVDHQPNDGNPDSLVEADGDGMKQPRDGLTPDQECNHRQNDGAAEPGKIAELAGAEGETHVLGMMPGIAIGQRRQQQCARVRRHVQAVGDQREGAEQTATDDLHCHHDAAQPDDRPHPAGVTVMPRAEGKRVCAGRASA
jgi:hypothetical protein